MKYMGKWLCLLLVFSFLVACSEDKKKPAAVEQAETPPTKEDARFNVANIARGALVYQENCAQCHGPEAQGHPDWRHAKQQGYAAAPPLDGTGPAAKMKKSEIIAVIKNGVKYKGEPVMPAWQGRVNDQDIEDVITWFQALWPSDVYANWQKRNLPGAGGKEAKNTTKN
jgi:mono/diheme cytochrome c family protein